MAEIERKKFTLTPREYEDFRRLPPAENFAFKFWKAVAEARGLDYRSILGSPSEHKSFTALPLRHGKDWCYPSPLKLEKRPDEMRQFGVMA